MPVDELPFVTPEPEPAPLSVEGPAPAEPELPGPVVIPTLVTSEPPLRTPTRAPVVRLVGELPRAGDESPIQLAPGHASYDMGTTPLLTQSPLHSYAAAGQMPPGVRMLIPAIKLDSKIVHLGVKQEEGKWIWETPDHAVGHHDGTANPREGSNVVFSGHISSPVKGEGSVFARLPEVNLGDLVFVETAQGVLPYMVDTVKLVAPTDLWVMDPTEGEVLTLITCYPDLVYSHRLVVTALPLPMIIF